MIFFIRIIMVLLAFGFLSPVMASQDDYSWLQNVSKEALMRFKTEDSAFGVKVLDVPSTWVNYYNRHLVMFKGERAPTETRFYLLPLPWPDKVGQVTSVGFKKNGEMYIWGDRQDVVYTCFDNIAIGQKLCYYLLNDQGEPVATWDYIPFPAVVKSGCGYRIAFQPIDLSGQTSLFTAEGFDPFEEVTCTSRSGDEVLCRVVTASEQGSYTHITRPGVKGRCGGMAEMLYEGKKGQVKMRYAWGAAFFEWAHRDALKIESAYVHRANSQSKY